MMNDNEFVTSISWDDADDNGYSGLHKYNILNNKWTKLIEYDEGVDTCFICTNHDKSKIYSTNYTAHPTAFNLSNKSIEPMLLETNNRKVIMIEINNNYHLIYAAAKGHHIWNGSESTKEVEDVCPDASKSLVM